MKTVLIPIDFSETSLNAARYAAEMLKGRADTRVILYSMYEDDDEAENVGEYLENLKSELEKKGDHHIECIKESGDDLIDCIDRLAYQKSATLIIMGISEKSPLRQLLEGSNTLKIAEKNICPVMIIPPDTTYREVNNIAFTSDFRNVEGSTPVQYIKSVLEFFQARLHIVNVSNEHYVALTDEIKEEREKMAELFREFQPEFYFIGMNDFQEAIDMFVRDKGIDMILTVPRFHTGITGLFKISNTKKLVYHSDVPVLTAHELM